MATPVKKASPRKGGIFKIVAGSHIGPPLEGCECQGCMMPNGGHMYEQRTSRSPAGYDNDIIHAEQDLAALFNAGPSGIKFVRIGDLPNGDTPVATAMQSTGKKGGAK